MLGSVCTGAFLLGETGLLDGRRITAHWTFDDHMHSRFPKVRLDVNQLIVDDGDIITGGGVMSWVDLGLASGRTLAGPGHHYSNRPRPAGRSAPSRAALLQQLHPPPPSRRCHRPAGAGLAGSQWRNGTPGQLAEIAGLEGRTLLRRFRKATGLTPTDYVQRIRISKAQDLLCAGARALDSVAWEVGYRDPGAFRKVFTRIIGLSPGEYRKRFSR